MSACAKLEKNVFVRLITLLWSIVISFSVLATALPYSFGLGHRWISRKHNELISSLVRDRDQIPSGDEVRSREGRYCVVADNSHDFAIQTEYRTAGVAAVDRGIGLQEFNCRRVLASLAQCVTTAGVRQ